MAEIKVNVGDPKTKRTYTFTISEDDRSSVHGKKIGESIRGELIGKPGYELQITGGSDRAGFPMRPDIDGTGRRKILTTNSLGNRQSKGGNRIRKTVAGNTVGAETSQINVKVTKHGKAALAQEQAEEPQETETAAPAKESATEESKESKAEKAPQESKKAAKEPEAEESAPDEQTESKEADEEKEKASAEEEDAEEAVEETIEPANEEEPEEEPAEDKPPETESQKETSEEKGDEKEPAESNPEEKAADEESDNAQAAGEEKSPDEYEVEFVQEDAQKKPSDN